MASTVVHGTVIIRYVSSVPTYFSNCSASAAVKSSNDPSANYESDVTYKSIKVESTVALWIGF